MHVRSANNNKNFVKTNVKEDSVTSGDDIQAEAAEWCVLSVPLWTTARCEQTGTTNRCDTPSGCKNITVAVGQESVAKWTIGVHDHVSDLDIAEAISPESAPSSKDATDDVEDACMLGLCMESPQTLWGDKKPGVHTDSTHVQWLDSDW